MPSLIERVPQQKHYKFGGLSLAAKLPLPLLIITGESNAAGYALNTEATAAELAARAGIKILNNTGLVFEDLDVGSNANIGMGLDNTTHGLEIGIANAQAAGRFGYTPIYLVKSGQSGSRIASWDVGQTNWTNFLARVNAATSLLSGVQYTPFVLYSQGINDSVASMLASDWKTATIAHFVKLRTLLGAKTRIVMTKLPLGAAGATTIADYNTAMDEIAAADQNTKVVDISGASLRDSAHWDCAGMRLLAERMLDLIMPNGAVGAPSASPGAGAYSSPQSVTLQGGEGVYYTTDGSTPTTGSTKATAPVNVSVSQTIKAIAVKGSFKNSPVTSFAYNFPLTWDTSRKSANITLSNGNLDAVSTAGAGFNLVLGSSFYSSGKRYFELEIVGYDGANQNFFVLGVGTVPAGAYETYPGGYASSVGLQFPSSRLANGFVAGTGTFMGAAVGHVHGIAVDMDAGKMWIGDNNNFDPLSNGASPGGGVNPFATFTPGLALFPALGLYQNNPTNKVRIRAGASLAYSPPSGFSAW